MTEPERAILNAASHEFFAVDASAHNLRVERMAELVINAQGLGSIGRLEGLMQQMWNFGSLLMAGVRRVV